MAGEEAPKSVFPTLVGRPRHVVGFPSFVFLLLPSLHSFSPIHMPTLTYTI